MIADTRENPIQCELPNGDVRNAEMLYRLHILFVHSTRVTTAKLKHWVDASVIPVYCSSGMDIKIEQVPTMKRSSLLSVASTAFPVPW